MWRIVMIIVVLAGATLIGIGLWLYTPDKARVALEAKYLASPSDYREVAGLKMHVRDSGNRDAPVVILLHGFGASLHTWEPWAARLSDRFRVIRFDLPGFGLTGPDPTGDYSDRRSLEVLTALMDGLGLERASLIGNSMGGRLAWEFAAQSPNRVDRLVLISPDGFASAGFQYGTAPKAPFLLRLLPYVLPAALLRSSLTPAYGDPKALTDAVVTRYRDLLLAPGVRAAIIARTEQTILEDPVPLLQRIQAPTLVLWGQKDSMIPIANAADYVRALPHATFVRLPGLGHVPFEEAPDVSLKPVLAFLAGGRQEAPR